MMLIGTGGAAAYREKDRRGRRFSGVFDVKKNSRN